MPAGRRVDARAIREAPPHRGRAPSAYRRAVQPAGGGIHFMRVPPLFRRALGGRRGGRAADPRGGRPPRRRFRRTRCAAGCRPARCPSDKDWTPAIVAQARIVARLRARGHSLKQIRDATESGRLAFGYVEELLASERPRHTLKEAAKETGLEPALIERMLTTMGFGPGVADQLTEDDLQLLRYASAVLASGFPLIAFLQLIRVYGLALAQIADAEVRLFHLYVHEPLMRDGVPGLQMAEEMQGLAGELLPLASPIMDHVHQRFLQHFVEQDVIGHMESDLGDHTAGPRPAARGDRLCRPCRLHPHDRGTGRRGGRRRGRGVRRGGRAHAPRGRADHQDDRRRGHGRRRRPRAS